MESVLVGLRRRVWFPLTISAVALLLAATLSAGDSRYLRMIAVPSLAQAEKVREEFREGKPFEDLARSHSVDPSAPRGGYLGFVSLDRLNERFRNAASALKPGDISPPFQSGLEWVVLYRMRRDIQARVAELQEQGDQQLAQNNPKGALDYYQKAVWLYPDYAQGYFSLGVAHGLLDQVDAEKENYQRAIRLAPDFVQAHYNLGKVYAAEGDPYSAIRAFEQTIKIKPDHAEAYVNLAAIQLALGERDAAVQAAERAVEINPLLASAYYNLGLTRAAADLEGALNSFRMAATLDPNQLDARVNIAVALGRLGRVSEARQELTDLLEHNPDLEPAQRLLKQLNQLQPPSSSSARPPASSRTGPAPDLAKLEESSRRLLMQGKFLDASILVEQALQDAPERPSLRLLAAQARTARGTLLFAQGRLDSAADQWKQALFWLPDFQPALLGLARIATQLGAFDQAERLIEVAAKAEPEAPDVVLAKAKLEYERRNFFLAYRLLDSLRPGELKPQQQLQLVSLLLDLELQDKALQIAYSSQLDTEQALQLSHLLTEKALYADAERLLRDRSSAAARLQLAHLYLRQLRFDDSEPLLRELLREGYAPWQTRMLLGKLYIDAGQAADAVTYLEQAVEIDPENVNGIYQLALACDQAGRPDNAIGWLRRGLELEPSSDRLLFELGRLLVNQSELDEALPLLQRVIQHQPDHPRAHYVLGNLYRLLGDLPASRRHLKRFQELKAALEADRKQLKAKKAAIRGAPRNG